MLKLVPFNPEWVGSHRLDIKAIYRRPRWTKNDFDEDVQERDAEGRPLWDITTPLRVMDHHKLESKGFEYVTLASRDDLLKAYKSGTLLPTGVSWREYDQHQRGGPWNYKMYAAGVIQGDQAATDTLRAQVDQFGPEAVEAIRRATDPGFQLPPHLRTPTAVSVSEGEPVTASVPVRKRPGPKPKVTPEAAA